MHQHPDKVKNSTFLTQSCPKTRFSFGISEYLSQNKNQDPRDTVCANIQAKQTALTFLSQTSPKLDLGLEIQETNVASASSKYSVCQFSGKTDNFDPNLPKNKFWSQNFEKLRADAESAPPRYHV